MEWIGPGLKGIHMQFPISEDFINEVVSYELQVDLNNHVDNAPPLTIYIDERIIGGEANT